VIVEEITAEQARKNSESSNHGTAEVLAQIFKDIEAISKTGATSLTKMLNKEAVSSSELEGVVSKVKENGFDIQTTQDSSVHTVVVSWKETS